MNVGVLVSTFLAATVEVIEMVAIVVARVSRDGWAAGIGDEDVEDEGVGRASTGRARGFRDATVTTQ